MERSFYLRLAGQGLRMPIGADLTLREETDPEAALLDAERLGRVVAETARRYSTPLAFPLMDLTLEKADLLAFVGVAEGAIAQFHFDAAPPDKLLTDYRRAASRPFSRRGQANIEALRYVARCTDLLPVGMLIGPFSLMTKLLGDPITPVALAASGVGADEDAGVCAVERCLALATEAVLRSARAQIAAGAKAVVVCEPAANVVYLSPRQLRRNMDVFERYVTTPNLRVSEVLRQDGVDLVFHDCGELMPEMVERLARALHPVILSLGSSRRLWEDAALVPPDVVLFGNLPSKSFYSDTVLPVGRVCEMARELTQRMAECRHPFILGSECDVLHVPEAAATIRRKVEAMLTA
jgi:hypothetical protein